MRSVEDSRVLRLMGSLDLVNGGVWKGAESMAKA